MCVCSVLVFPIGHHKDTSAVARPTSLREHLRVLTTAAGRSPSLFPLFFWQQLHFSLGHFRVHTTAVDLEREEYRLSTSVSIFIIESYTADWWQSSQTQWRKNIRL